MERPIDNLRCHWQIFSLLSTPDTLAHPFASRFDFRSYRYYDAPRIGSRQYFESEILYFIMHDTFFQSFLPAALSSLPFSLLPISFGWWDNPVPGWGSQRFRALVYLNLHTALFDLFYLMPSSYDSSKPCFVGLPRILFPISTRASIYIALMAVQINLHSTHHHYHQQ